MAAASEHSLTCIDIVGDRTQVVEVQVGQDGTTWVNIDGICRLRMTRPLRVVIEDNRRKT